MEFEFQDATHYLADVRWFYEVQKMQKLSDGPGKKLPLPVYRLQVDKGNSCDSQLLYCLGNVIEEANMVPIRDTPNCVLYLHNFVYERQWDSIYLSLIDDITRQLTDDSE